MAASPCKLLSGLPTTVQNEGVHSPRHNAYRLQHWRRRRPCFLSERGSHADLPCFDSQHPDDRKWSLIHLFRINGMLQTLHLPTSSRWISNECLYYIFNRSWIYESNITNLGYFLTPLSFDIPHTFRHPTCHYFPCSIKSIVIAHDRSTLCIWVADSSWVAAAGRRYVLSFSSSFTLVGILFAKLYLTPECGFGLRRQKLAFCRHTGHICNILWHNITE